MPANARRKTVFDADDDLLTKFQSRLKLEKTTMNSVIENWIRECMEGKRALSEHPLPTEGTCPVCESQFKMTPDGAQLVKAGPIESLTPGTIPEEMMPVVLNFVEAYLADPIFAQTVNGIIELHRLSKR